SELAQTLREVAHDGRRIRIEPNSSPDGPADRPDLRDEVAQVLLHLRAALEDVLACVGQLDAARRADEQGDAQCMLEVRQAPAERGGRDVLAFGSTRNRALLCRSHEEADGVDIDS